jgi:formylglycine-generating enzyme required for sulfatase activity
MFPWGERFKGSLLNACDRGCAWNPEGTGVDDGYAETAPVGSYPGGASWVGAMDMSGNVWEWTGSLYGPYGADGGGEDADDGAIGGERRVLRGGSWYHTGTDLLRSAARYGVSPEYADYVTGFRCVISVDSSQ